MRVNKFATILAVSLLAGSAMADDAPEPRQKPMTQAPDAGPLERGFARMERGISRLQTRLSARPANGTSEGCGGMMSGGMMGGGMMGGRPPNDQWHGTSAR